MYINEAISYLKEKYGPQPDPLTVDVVEHSIKRLILFAENQIESDEDKKAERVEHAYDAIQDMAGMLEEISRTIESLVEIIALNDGDVGNDEGDLESAAQVASKAAELIRTFFVWKQNEEEHRTDDEED